MAENKKSKKDHIFYSSNILRIQLSDHYSRGKFLWAQCSHFVWSVSIHFLIYSELTDFFFAY